MSTTPQSVIRELDHRKNDDIAVSLLWNSRTNQVFVAIEDARTRELVEVTVSGSDALDAFHHPYLYCANDALPTIGRGTA